MNRRKLVTVAITAIMALGFSAMAEEKKVGPQTQTTCPVMGGKINKAQYADVKGKRIYVCCPGCIGKIKADPDKYIKQMEAEGIVLDKTPKQEDHSGHKQDHSGHKH
jgi:YHS domain-containing protein